MRAQQMTLQVCFHTEIRHVTLVHICHARSTSSIIPNSVSSLRTFAKGFTDHPKGPVPSIGYTGNLVPYQ